MSERTALRDVADCPECDAATKTHEETPAAVCANGHDDCSVTGFPNGPCYDERLAECDTCGGSGSVTYEPERDDERRDEEKREAKIEAKIAAEAPPIRPMGVEDPDDEPDGAVVTEPDFDAAGEAYYGQAEYDRIHRERLRAELLSLVTDAYLLHLTWTAPVRKRVVRDYQDQVVDLGVRGLLAESAATGSIRRTPLGDDYYSDLPPIFVVDRSSPQEDCFELVAKGETTDWVSVSKEIEHDDQAQSPAIINWSAIGSVDEKTARVFAEMVVTAAGIAERLNREEDGS